MGKNKNKLIKLILLFCFFFVLKDKSYAAPAPPMLVPTATSTVVFCSAQGFNCTQKLIDPSVEGATWKYKGKYGEVDTAFIPNEAHIAQIRIIII